MYALFSIFDMFFFLVKTADVFNEYANIFIVFSMCDVFEEVSQCPVGSIQPFC